MFIWGLITPMVLLTELVTGRAINKRRACDSIDNGYHCHEDISRSWGPYTPYFSLESDYRSAKIDKKCKVTFAQVLSRHGARYPTEGAGKGIKTTVDKIQAQAISYSKKTAFIKAFNYTLGADELTTFGEIEMYNSGIKFYRRYKSLANKCNPFIRASSQQRVIDSGSQFTQGFIDEKTKKTGNPVSTFPPPVIIYEGEEFNNTLDHGACREFEDGKYSNLGSDAQATYAAKFTNRIVKRLNMDIPGANISSGDVINLMSLCPYYTVVEPTGDPLPKFCDIFSDEEFKNYNYYLTLGKYYGYGPGNPLGPAQGIGFVNELIARLTGSTVNDSTSTNTTLDGNPATFPLGRKLYADFSHDNSMVSVFSALNLFEGTHDLSKDHSGHGHKFNVAELVPFASRMYVEKLKCEGEKEELVRILINDRVMELKGCDEKKYGACSIGDFVEMLKWARNGGNWNECW
ncbi:hypothetical protein H072_10637 [Dactylellina haptotyla CBS 200.50]|uniref:Phytase A n=1 Tax=Dactylellina haptotyla (strain CBS 200.50) TaxID=1284197 RepID=S8BKY8_DACHA|nr:hypothetical protein H072_10637 [Dactylellina haptotyla CBS 200.50]